VDKKSWVVSDELELKKIFAKKQSVRWSSGKS
jgi:hypothetical protein